MTTTRKSNPQNPDASRSRRQTFSQRVRFEDSIDNQQPYEPSNVPPVSAQVRQVLPSYQQSELNQSRAPQSSYYCGQSERYSQRIVLDSIQPNTINWHEIAGATQDGSNSES